ncbi:DUF4097 family beta strand repeat-containing protein [Georgenia subflava]|uniref:DUF4097 family beta strand repeat protein n=1 Tax=Georgenia subflava TaxID=1622177 RepID=A0A6N7EFS4_9MICO|nr:DUF4097 family beta strand repeat-containing protein [Georgenia subflava]MPV36969.1 DUF4097 family beta strand repeat protein [Georgenia subflava]
MTEYDFPVAGTVRVQAAVRSSDLVLTAADVDRVAVRLDPTRSDTEGQSLAEQTLVELAGNVLRIEVPPSRSRLFGSSARLRITITVPTGSELDVRSGSGDVSTSGALSGAQLRTGSGDVDLAEAEEVEVTTGSGDVTVASLGTGQLVTGSGDATVGAARRFLRTRSGSGDVVVGSAADLEGASGSGDLLVKELSGRAVVRTASGDVVIRRAVRGEIEAKTASGDVSVRVLEGTAVLLDCSTVSGTLRSTLEPGAEPGPGDDALLLRARTVSGDVVVQRTA